MLQIKDKVLISGQPGIEKRYPNFAKGFVGMHGTIVGLWKFNGVEAASGDLLEVQIAGGDASQRVWTRRDWLTLS